MRAPTRALDATDPAAPTELRRLLHELLDGRDPGGHILDVEPLVSGRAGVLRVRLADSGRVRSLVAKRLEPIVAQRNELVANRWLPAVGLEGSGPALVGIAAEGDGRGVWHVYEDLGDWALDAEAPQLARVKAAVELIGRIHARFAVHPLLAECRLYGGDRGIAFYTGSVRDAIRCLEKLRPPRVEMSSEQRALRDRLLERLNAWLGEWLMREAAQMEFGGPETLLHGDLWTFNVFVMPMAHDWHARLIDWDKVAVGPAGYDLSTFLLRFPNRDRAWVLDAYRDSEFRSCWSLPSDGDLNLLFETAERARFANMMIWPAIALLHDGGDWGIARLTDIEQWVDAMRPVLGGEGGVLTAAPAQP